MLADTLLAPIAALINSGIERNEAAADLCAAIEGRSMVVHIAGLPTGDWSICISAADGGIELTSGSANESAGGDVIISGPVIELNRLMFIDNRAPLREGRVAIEGDTELAEQYRELLLLARPDLEDRLADWVGESAAFHIGTFVRDLRDWARDSAEDMALQTGRYLQDDARQVPTPEEANEFYAHVDELANDVERLAARIARTGGREPQS